MSLDPSQGECCVSSVTEMVKKQVGFDVLLLDSKLHPVMDNESIMDTEFSQCKIIAVSCTAYKEVEVVVSDSK